MGIKYSNIWEGIKHHAPRIRTLDTLVGAGVGGLAGLGTAAYSNWGEEDKKKRSRTNWTRGLVGAGLGAGLGNVVGDRARRYISNSVVPYSYKSKSRLNELTPKSWEDFKQRALYDKPVANIQGTNVDRRDLWRWGMDLPVRPRENQFFEHFKDNTYVAKPGRKATAFKGGKHHFANYLGTHSYDEHSDNTVTSKDKWDFALHDDDKDQLRDALSSLHNPEGFAERWPTEEFNTTPVSTIKASLMRILAQSLLNRHGGADVRIRSNTDGVTLPLNKYTAADLQ